MPKFVDFCSDREVQDIMEKFLEKFPEIFEGFDVGKIGFVVTKKKKSKKPIRLHCVGYPHNVWLNKVYIVEVFDGLWKRMDTKRRNLAAWHVMCAVPDGGFDEASKHYGKKLQPEIRMYMKEFAACGGVPNWMENPAAADPMEQTVERMAASVPVAEDAIPDGTRTPVTVGDVAGNET